MHISEGVLSAPVLFAGWGATAVFTAIGLKKMDFEQVMSVGVLSAAFFLASLIHVPVGPGSVHLVLNGLLGVILGWACFPAILTGLLLQALFFQYGGLTVLGVNTFNMAFPALVLGLSLRPLLLHSSKKRTVAAFMCGAGGVLFAAILMALSLGLSDQGFITAGKMLILSNTPIMLVEGVITVFTVSFVAKVQPGMLHAPLQPAAGKVE